MPKPLLKEKNRGPKLVTTLYAAQTRKYHAQALREELRNQEQAKKLVQREVVEREFFKIARTVRDAMENLPSRLAGILAAERNQEKIFTILQQEIRQCLETLTNK